MRILSVVPSTLRSLLSALYSLLSTLMYRPLVILSTSGMLVGALGAVALAQAPRRPLTPDDWDRWRSISSPAISNDGRWVAYSLVPQVGDGDFVIRATSA